MTLLLTWRNLWRNRRRTLITLSSVAFAVMLAVVMQSFQKGVFDHLVNNVVSFYYGYLQVHKKGYWDEQVLDNSFEYNDTLVRQTARVPHVTGVVPRLETFILVASGNTSKGCLLAGTDPEAETALTGLGNRLTSGSLFGKDEAAAVIAEGLAGRLKLKSGDTLILLGQGYHGALAAGKYPIRGIVRYGSPSLNESMVFLPLAEAQQLLQAEGNITSLSIRIDDPRQLETVQASLASLAGTGYEVMNWKELMPDISSHIRADRSSFYVFTGILYLIIAFGLFGTILMMTSERRYEFGMLIAIGMKKRVLGSMLLGESMLITLMGVLTGLLLSLPLVTYFAKYPPRLSGNMARVYEEFGFEPVFPAALEPGILINQSAMVLALALLAGLYPLWHIRRLDPVTAMKR